MPLFTYTTLDPASDSSVTIDSGKPTLDKAFRDIRAYCKRNGYPLPSKDQIIDHAKPTPGPWDCDACTTFYATPHESDAMTMIEIRANVTEDGWDTVAFIEAIWPGAEANARLIAAAPDHHANALYLDSIAPDVGPLPDDTLVEIVITAKAIRDIRAAIAKATAKGLSRAA